MLIAAITKEGHFPRDAMIQLPENQLILLNVIGAIILVVGISVYARMLRNVHGSGSRIRNDLFGLPDVLVGVTLVTLLLFLLSMQWISPEPGAAAGAARPAGNEDRGLQIIRNSLFFALPVLGIVGLLIQRNINLGEIFGLRRMSLIQAITLAGALILLFLPIFLLVTGLAFEQLGKDAKPQEMVEIYQNAARTGKTGILWQIVIAAVVIAPVSEEILFRGYCYPVFRRMIGPLPAAFGISILFAAIHNNALAFPGLTVLALALTLVYERTGSLMVSIFMHAWFNGLSLFIMWWAVTHDPMK